MRTKLTIILLIFLSGMLFAANTLSLEPNGEGTWDVNFTYLPSEGDGPAEFAFNQSTLLSEYFFVEVSLDGTPLESDDWVGAFNGDICVGARQWDTSGCNNGVCEVRAN